MFQRPKLSTLNCCGTKRPERVLFQQKVIPASIFLKAIQGFSKAFPNGNFSFQCIPVEDTQGCVISHANAISNVDSAVIRFTTTGKECNFTVTDIGSDSDQQTTDCHQSQGSEDGYECELQSLEPATTYQLRIKSITNGVQENLSISTGKSLIPLKKKKNQICSNEMNCTIHSEILSKPHKLILEV